MAEVYVNATTGTDHEASGFTDGSFANATLTLTKAIGYFTNAAVNDKLYLTDNGSGEVTAGMYRITGVTDNDNVVLDADIRSGANDPTDVVCTQGAGTLGSPYATLQHAFDNIAQGASGDTFWLFGADILTATLNLPYAPSATKPCCVRGWNGADATTDGTGLSEVGGPSFQGSIDGNDADFTLADEAILFYNLKLHNTGAADILAPAGTTYHTGAILCELCDCELVAIDSPYTTLVYFNYIHDIAGIGVTGGTIVGNYFKDGAVKTFTKAINIDESSCVIERNIISLSDVGSNGIEGYAYGTIRGNSILHTAAGTGSGISDTGHGVVVTDNLIEGFSGLGGNAITGSEIPVAHGNNSYFNCTAGISFSAVAPVDLGGDEGPLASTPFAKAGADSYENRMAYFAPLDVGSVFGGAYGQ